MDRLQADRREQEAVGVSQTAIEIINGRWTMHVFGLRDDHAAAKLAKLLFPIRQPLGYGWPFSLSMSIRALPAPQGGIPPLPNWGKRSLANLVMNRTGYFDSVIDKAKEDAEQFVVMGAGFDTRAYNDLKNSDLRMFELDQAKTQRLKRACLEKAGIDTAHVTFVETDFSREDWFGALVAAGYDATKRTIFLWEGVTLYLGETSVRNVLRTVKANAAIGSVIVADIYAKSFLSGEYNPSIKATLPILDMTDEVLSFGLEMAGNRYEESLESFVTSEGLSVGESYFMGYKTEKGAWMVVVELKV